MNETARRRATSPIAGDRTSTRAEGATRATVATDRDATGFAPLPAELIAAQQVNNVGMLASGLAHDMNNLLTVILGSAELAHDTLPPASPAQHHLRTIVTTVRRAGEMCRSLLACARADQQTLQPVDVSALVRSTVTLLQSSRLALHRVRLDLAENLPPLHGNPAQLRQMVLNLLANAAEACGPRGGRIRISTTVAQVDTRAARQLRPAGVDAGQFMRLRVADDGCGMDEETQLRLFTPFFTRKAEGRGLGLASLLEIARNHGGGVRVFSEPGRGSIFDVFVPLPSATDADPQPAAPGSSGANPPPEERRHGTVLLADDEELLRQSLDAFLTAQGLSVHAVGDGEAIFAKLAAPLKPDVILLDLIMPKLGGLEVLRRLRENGHRTPVILMTGHADVAVADLVGGLEPVVVLSKPFSLTELVRVIGEMLPRQ